MGAKVLHVQSVSAVACDMQRAISACLTRYIGATSTQWTQKSTRMKYKHANSIVYFVINFHHGKWAPCTANSCCGDTCARATSLSAFALRLATSLHYTHPLNLQIHTPVSVCGKTQHGMQASRGPPCWLAGCRALRPLSLTLSNWAWETGSSWEGGAQPRSLRKATRCHCPWRLKASLTRFTASFCSSHQITHRESEATMPSQGCNLTVLAASF